MALSRDLLHKKTMYKQNWHLTTNRTDYSSISQLLKAYSVSFPILVITPDTTDGAVTPVFLKECIRMYLRTSKLASTEMFPTVH